MTKSNDSTNLDVLRSFAVLSVIAHHIAQVVFNPNSLSTLGRSGVLIFFVHTAYVLMLSLERLDSRNVNLFKAFYVQRLFRIYPLSIVCVLIVAVVHRAPSGTPDGFPMLLSNIALVQNLTWQDSIIGPLWSLPYEVQMYLWLPFLYLVARKKFSLIWLSVLWLLAAASAELLRNSDPRYLLEKFRYQYYPLSWFVPTFLGGVFAYSLSKTKRLHIPGVYWPVLVAGLLVGFEYFNPNHGQWFMCLLGFAIPQFQEIRITAVKIVSHNIAKFSYGLYLTNLPLLSFFFHHAAWLNEGVRWIGFVTCLSAASVAGYYFVEKPMIRLGHGIARRITRSRVNVDLTTEALAPSK